MECRTDIRILKDDLYAGILHWSNVVVFVWLLITGDVEVTTPEKTFTLKQGETIYLRKDDEYY